MRNDNAGVTQSIFVIGMGCALSLVTPTVGTWTGMGWTGGIFTHIYCAMQLKTNEKVLSLHKRKDRRIQ